MNEEKRAKRDREKERQDNKMKKMKKETMKHRPQNRTNEWDAKTVMQMTKISKYQINNLFFETFLFLL